MKKHNQTQKKDKENNIADRIKIPSKTPSIALSIALSSVFIFSPWLTLVWAGCLAQFLSRGK